MPHPNPISSNRRHRGASSTEYMLILALVVIPIALTTPLMFHMINTYTNRLIWVIALPFG